jgi:hypothetical protein
MCIRRMKIIQKIGDRNLRSLAVFSGEMQNRCVFRLDRPRCNLLAIVPL